MKHAEFLDDLLDVATAAVIWAFFGGVFLVLYLWAAGA